MKVNRTIVIASVAVVAAIMLIFSASSFMTNTSADITYIPNRELTLSHGENVVREASAAPACGDTLAEVKSKTSFPVLTPTVLISGYSLRGADASDDRIQLFYHDKEVCGENAETMADGVLQLVAGPLDTVDDAKDGEAFANKYLKIYNDSGIDAQIYEFPNGMHAVGYPAGIGTSHYIENDEEVLTKTYDYPASIWVIDDSNQVAYRLKAYAPLEDLATIGQSLKLES